MHQKQPPAKYALAGALCSEAKLIPRPIAMTSAQQEMASFKYIRAIVFMRALLPLDCVEFFPSFYAIHLIAF
jgi:hypothetical protein